MSIFYSKVFYPAAEIVAGRHIVYDRVAGQWVKPYDGRAWFAREFDNHTLHPAIVEMLDDRGARPVDWHQLLLEWPHRSVSDYNRLAYTRDERAGEADRQTVTSLGKYLTRHFPHIDGHVIRDLVARHNAEGEFQIRRTVSEIVAAAMEGPRSCMSADLSVRCDDGVKRHPYEVYDPKLGWAVAVRVNGDDIDGRALVWTDPECNDMRGFVRTYKRGDNFSYPDEALCAWLKEQGYEHWGEWPDDTPLMYYSVRNTFLAPYIDGGTQHVSICGGLLHIDNCGVYECDSTGGTAEEQGEECEDCGERCDEDDMYWVGRWEDRRICCSCCESDYVYARGRNGNHYYVHTDDAAWVESKEEYYDDSYLDDNNIIQLENGEYEHMDNAVEINDEWYHADDDRVCWDSYNERHALLEDCVDTEDEGMVHKDDAWQCYATDKYYSDNIDSVEVDGETYHPDHVPTNETN